MVNPRPKLKTCARWLVITRIWTIAMFSVPFMYAWNRRSPLSIKSWAAESSNPVGRNVLRAIVAISNIATTQQANASLTQMGCASACVSKKPKTMATRYALCLMAVIASFAVVRYASSASSNVLSPYSYASLESASESSSVLARSRWWFQRRASFTNSSASRSIDRRSNCASFLSMPVKDRRRVWRGGVCILSSFVPVVALAFVGFVA